MTAPRDPFFPSDRSIRSASEPPEIRRLGTVDYLEAWHLQADLAAARHRGEIGDVILVLEHPSTYTAGKRTQPEDLPDNGLPVIDVDRGGRITWHGEGQLVVYPIIELADPVDVVDYVRRLEEALIQTVRRVGVPDVGRIDGRSGVWVPADPDDAGGHVSTEPGALPGTILTGCGRRRVRTREWGRAGEGRGRGGRRGGHLAAPAGPEGRRARHPRHPRGDHARAGPELLEHPGVLPPHRPVRHPGRRGDHAFPRAGPPRQRR